MIIIKIAGQDSFQMTLVQYDDMIQTISPNAANHSFHEGILPRTPRRSQHFFDAHAFDSPLELGSVDAIPIPQ